MNSQAKHNVASWAAKLGRLGLAARGIVYIMVGYLAVAAAAGRGGKLTDKQGALVEIDRLPFGDAILWVVAVGLIGYVTWRILQGVLDLDAQGTSRKGLSKRAASLSSGVAYASLSTAALSAALGKSRLHFGSAPSRGDAAAQDWTAWLMSQPFGQWLVGIAGAVVGGVALYQFYQAISCRFTKHLRGEGLTREQETWSRRAGQMGYASRGVAFSLVAWFLVNAALHSNSKEAGGLAKALRTLSHQPHGTWLLGIVGLGLALFGAYSIIESRYRRIGQHS